MIMARTEQNIVGRHKRTAGQIEVDRTTVVDLYVKGHTQRQITKWICANRPYTLSRAQVAADLHHTLDEWKDERLTQRDEFVRKQMLKFAKMETELWEAWERSKSENVKTMSKSHITNKGGSKEQQPIEATVTRETRTGDVAYMRAIMNVQVLLHHLLGLGAPRRFRPDDDDDKIIDVEEAPQIVLYLPKNGREVEGSK
jgi:hypothetical protein